MDVILMLMTISSLLTSSFAIATETDICATFGDDGDICPIIVSNQIALYGVNSHIEEAVRNITDQLLKNNEEVTELKNLLNGQTEGHAEREEELKSCQTHVHEQQSEVTSLKNKQREKMQATEAKKTEMDEIAEMVQSLNAKKLQLANKIDCMKEEIQQQKDQVATLKLMDKVPMDCADLQLKGMTEDKVYDIYPYLTEESVQVKCDFTSDGGAWTVFFSRLPQAVPLSFDVPWNDYKNGFGDASLESWIGNDVLHALTSYDRTSVRLDAAIFNGTQRHASWDNFHVANEDDEYQLTLEGYQPDSTLGDSLSLNNKCNFTTHDMDNDIVEDLNCARDVDYHNMGAGAWWYHGCGYSRLTAPLKDTSDWDSACYAHWEPGVVALVSLKTISMKLRRHNYRELTGAIGSSA